MASWIPLVVAFSAGFLSFALILLATVLFLFHRLLLLPLRRPRSSSTPSSPSAAESDASSSASASHHIFLQGHLWIAAVSNKDYINREVNVKDLKKKDAIDDIFHTRPSRRFAKVEDSVLSLVAEDGTEERADLKGCSIHAVSAGKEASRKWAKKYPIQVECSNQKIFLGSSLCLLYFETAWDKEIWCQVLRAASRWTTEKEDWYMTCKREFHEYSLQLDKTYPSFSKLIKSKSENIEDANIARLDNVEAAENLSRRQRIWRKIIRNTSWRGNGGLQKESVSDNVKVKLLESNSVSENVDHQSSVDSQYSKESSLCHGIVGSDSSIQISGKSDEPKFLDQATSNASSVPVLDQGAICWNVLCSRLFFDAYQTKQFQDSCLRLVQKQLSKIVTPGYMGKLMCTDVDLGKQPPYFQSFNVLPKDPGYISSFDSVIEYSGGAVLKIETNMNVRDFMSQENIPNQNPDPVLPDENVLVGFDDMQNNENGRLSLTTGNMKDTKISSNPAAQTSKGGWKSVLARVADQVSMVPITLSLRLVSFKGIVRVRIKSPPTDRIWFGFTSMPLIDLQPEPSIGEYRITTGLLVTFITNKIKALIQDSCVLPNCEGIWIPWMISETNNWIPQTDMPAPWSAHTDNSSSDYPLAREDIKGSTAKGISSTASSNEVVTLKHASSTETIPRKYDTVSQHTATFTHDALLLKDAASKEKIMCNDAIIKDVPSGGILKTSSNEIDAPLLKTSKLLSNSESGSPDRSGSSSSIKGLLTDDKGNRASTRARVLSLGKKVTGKLDEKRRMVVEKVREGLEKYEHSVRGAREDE